jgi:hypothetical protein
MNVSSKFLTKILLVFSVLLLLGLGIYYFFSIVPINNQLKAANQTLDQEEAYLSALTNKEEAYSEMDDEELTNFLERVPPKAFMEYWLVELENVETKSDTTIESFQFTRSELQTVLGDRNQNNEEAETDEADESTVIQQIDASLVVQASDFEELNLFLEEVENLTRMTSVLSFSFSEPNTTDSGELITLNLSVRTYYIANLASEFPDYQPEGSFQEAADKENPF